MFQFKGWSKFILFALGIVGLGVVGLAYAWLAPRTVVSTQTLMGLTRAQAEARARTDAAQAGPEFGLVDWKIDKVNAEILSRAEAESRFGVSSPGIDPNQQVWWVKVDGKFVYESMPMPNGRPFYESDNRIFVYARNTGDVIGSGSLGPSKFVGLTPLPPTLAPTR